MFYSSRGSNLDATDYDKNGVKFLQDGLPVTAADGNNHNRALDPLNARFVTIAHGANALAYGASTLGGAIDFTTPTARTTDAFSASLSGGSFGQWERAPRWAASPVSLDGLVTAETLQRDGYREHSKQDRKNVYANVGWQSSETVTTRFYGTYSDYYAELPRELTPAQYEAGSAPGTRRCHHRQPQQGCRGLAPGIQDHRGGSGGRHAGTGRLARRAVAVPPHRQLARSSAC